MVKNLTRAQREEAMAKSIKSRETSKSAAKMVAEIRSRLTSKQVKQVESRMKQMPSACRRVYQRAMRGRSAKAALKAHCQECVGWGDMRNQIKNCTAFGCALYPYRPYQAASEDEDYVGE